MVNTSQQIGGSIGTALLSTLAAAPTTASLTDHGRAADARGAAAVHGYTTAFWWSAAIFAVGLLMAVVLFPTRVKPTEPALAAESAGQAELALATE